MVHTAAKQYSNKIFVWLGIATLALLAVPLIAMQFTNDIQWSVYDFLVAGLLVFGASSTVVLANRKLNNKRSRLIVGVIITLSALWSMVELAVGLLTNIGR